MLKKLGLAVTAFAFIAGTASIASAGPLGACKACHFLDKDQSQVKNNLGPGLLGIVGKAPSISDVPYAVWDEAALDEWLTNPKAVKPSTKMTFKQKKEKKRAKIIEALKANN